MKYSPSNSQLSIYTTREGALSPVGHDLHLVVDKFAIDVDDESGAVSGDVNTSTIRVVGACVDGVTESMGSRDAKKINAKVQQDVFSKGSAMTLGGNRDAIEVAYGGVTAVTRKASEFEAIVRLSALGLKPVTAFFGALRVSDDVRVVLTPND